MSVPWLGADWHLAGDFRDVTRCLPARVQVGFGKRTVWKYTHTRHTKESTSGFVSNNTICVE